MSSSKCCFLTSIQVSQETGQVVWYSHLFQNFPVYCDPHSQRLWLVNKAEIDVFLELSCFFDDPADVGNLISGFSAFSKTSLNIWKFMVHLLVKPGLENFEHYFTICLIILYKFISYHCPPTSNPRHHASLYLSSVVLACGEIVKDLGTGCCHCLVTKSCSTLWDLWTVDYRLLESWNFPGKNTGVNCHFLLQGIFWTLGRNMRLLH